jgi:hypothetical protein
MRPDSAIFPVENGNPGDPWPKPKLYTSRRERYSGPRTPRGASHGTAARSPEGTEPSVDARIGGTTVPLGKCTAWVGLRWDFPLQRTVRPSPTPWAVPLPPVRRRREGAGGSCGRGAHRRCQIQERDRSRSAQDETQAEGSRPVHIAGGQHTPCEPRRGLRGWEAARVWRARRGTPGPSAGGSGKRLAYGAVFFSAFAFVAWPAG